jgi:hypothetical protein
MAKKATEVKDLIIDGSMDYKLTIDKEGYSLATSNTINNDVAAMLHARGIVDMIKKDSEMTKQGPMWKVLKAKDKKMFNDRYDKLIHASYILEKLAGELLYKAMIASDRKD